MSNVLNSTRGKKNVIIDYKLAIEFVFLLFGDIAFDTSYQKEEFYPVVQLM